jgi:hypothetical protein
VLHGAQPGSTAIGTDLTPPVATAVERLLGAIEAELTRWLNPPTRPPPRCS